MKAITKYSEFIPFLINVHLDVAHMYAPINLRVGEIQVDLCISDLGAMFTVVSLPANEPELQPVTGDNFIGALWICADKHSDYIGWARGRMVYWTDLLITFPNALFVKTLLENDLNPDLYLA